MLLVETSHVSISKTNLENQNSTPSSMKPVLRIQPNTINFFRFTTMCKDVVEATILGLQAPSGVYNTGSGEPRSFNDMISILQKYLKTNVETEYFDNPYPFYQPHTEADLSLSRKALKYDPKYSLEKGIK